MVLNIHLPWLEEIVAAKNPRRLPVVLTALEVRSLLNEMSGSAGLVASVLYGTGMRLTEGLRLRVKDVEFQRREILVLAASIRLRGLGPALHRLPWQSPSWLAPVRPSERLLSNPTRIGRAPPQMIKSHDS